MITDNPQPSRREWLGAPFFTGLHKPIPGGLTVVVLTTDTREKSGPEPDVAAGRSILTEIF